MNWLKLLTYGLGLIPSLVLGVQTEVGDAKSGADKKQMVKDGVTAALQGAASVLPEGSTNAAAAQAAAATAISIIDTTDAISKAVNHTKATGAYQTATTAASTKAAAAQIPLLDNSAAAAPQSEEHEG